MTDFREEEALGKIYDSQSDAPADGLSAARIKGVLSSPCC